MGRFLSKRQIGQRRRHAAKRLKVEESAEDKKKKEEKEVEKEQDADEEVKEKQEEEDDEAEEEETMPPVVPTKPPPTFKTEPMDSDYPPQLEDPVSLSPTYNLDESAQLSGENELIDIKPAPPSPEATAFEESVSPEPEPTLPSGLTMDIKEEPFELSPHLPEAAPDPLQIQSCLFCFCELSNEFGPTMEDSTLCKRIEFVLVAKFNFPKMSCRVPCCTSCVQMFDLFYEFKKNCLAALTKQDELHKAKIFEPIKLKQTKPPETKQIQVVKTEKLIEKKPGKQHKEVEKAELAGVTAVKVPKKKVLGEPPKAIGDPEKPLKSTKVFVNEEEAGYHMNEHSEVNHFKCRIIACKQVFPTPEACFKHETICATTSKICDICSLVFPTASALKVHKIAHTIAQDGENPTAVCGGVESDPLPGTSNKETTDSAETRSCRNCGQKFPLAGDILLQHQRKCTNTQRKRFQCPRCDKCYIRRGTLEAHLRRHDGIRPFRCGKPGCEKTFLDQWACANHREGCGTLGFVCDVCGATLSTQVSLKAHREKHEEPKVHCNHCEKRFHDKKSLNKHMSVHSNERKFECKVCGKRFKSSEANRVHQRIHTKEKPYACPECDQRFTYNCSLKAHLDKKACIVR